MASIDTKLYGAVGILAVLGGALYLTNKKEQEEARQYSLAGQTAELPKIQISEEETKKVNKITLQKPAGDAGAAVEVVLVKKGEDWKLEQPVEAAANQANVKSLLDNLKTLKVVELIDPGKAAYAKFEVDDEHAFHAKFEKDGGSVLDVLVGQNGGRGQMMRVSGKDGVFAVKGYSSYLYTRDVKGWRDMGLFKFEEADVTAVDITNENGHYAFAKAEDKWSAKFGKTEKGKTAALKELAEFEQSKIKDMIRAYKSLNADNYNAEKKSAADVGLEQPVAVVTFQLKDGGKREVKVGSTAEGSSRWVLASGKEEIFSISSWAADWATAKEEKFRKKADDDKPANPHAGMGAGMPPGMHAEPEEE